MIASYLTLHMMSNVDVVIHRYVWLHSVESADGSQLGAMKAYVMDSLPISVDLVLGLDALLRSSLSLNIQNKRCDVSFGAGRVAEATVWRVFRCSASNLSLRTLITKPPSEREVGGEMEMEGRVEQTYM